MNLLGMSRGGAHCFNKNNHVIPFIQNIFMALFATITRKKKHFFNEFLKSVRVF